MVGGGVVGAAVGGGGAGGARDGAGVGAHGPSESAKRYVLSNTATWSYLPVCVHPRCV
jgi:hypothetical protein